ncbi:hypothetical protein AB0H36_11030 [Kribbella sp. NPDC050820]|uniref:hypothetical protein n=1 Tax=Kribbella sp. NPDC050820 TaxID=3155408 RepID=UPI0033E2341A
MENAETIFLIGLGVLLVVRAVWQSVAHRRHLAWIAAFSGPVALVGFLVERDWPFVVGVGLLVVGEFLYQTNDELSPADLKEFREDIHIGNRRRRLRRSTSSRGRHTVRDAGRGRGRHNARAAGR